MSLWGYVMSEEKILHGNNAKVEKTRKMVGSNITNQAALAGKNKDADPAVNDLMTEAGREFSQENKK